MRNGVRVMSMGSGATSHAARGQMRSTGSGELVFCLTHFGTRMVQAGTDTAVRDRSFGEGHGLTPVDRLGIWLSRRQIRRWVPELRGKVIGDFGCGFDAQLARSVLDEVSQAYLADVSLAPDLPQRSC